jgi:hypothetical protein
MKNPPFIWKKFKKASHHFEKSLNSIENVFKIFEKASDFLLKPPFL